MAPSIPYPISRKGFLAKASTLLVALEASEALCRFNLVTIGCGNLVAFAITVAVLHTAADATDTKMLAMSSSAFDRNEKLTFQSCCSWCTLYMFIKSPEKYMHVYIYAEVQF